jgi:hypothetical protein
MKIFISQHMRGKLDEEILAEREWAKARLRRKLVEDDPRNEEEEIEVLDSFFQGTDAKPLACLGNALVLMAEADYVVFIPGWQNARGCRIEYHCCKEYGLKYLELA